MTIVCAFLAVITIMLSVIVFEIIDLKAAVERIKHEFTKIYDDDTWA